VFELFAIRNGMSLGRMSAATGPVRIAFATVREWSKEDTAGRFKPAPPNGSFPCLSWSGPLFCRPSIGGISPPKGVMPSVFPNSPKISRKKAEKGVAAVAAAAPGANTAWVAGATELSAHCIAPSKRTRLANPRGSLLKGFGAFRARRKAADVGIRRRFPDVKAQHGIGRVGQSVRSAAGLPPGGFRSGLALVSIRSSTETDGAGRKRGGRAEAPPHKDARWPVSCMKRRRSYGSTFGNRRQRYAHVHRIAGYAREQPGQRFHGRI
jgi:hypothetical protein